MQEEWALLHVFRPSIASNLQYFEAAGRPIVGQMKPKERNPAGTYCLYGLYCSPLGGVVQGTRRERLVTADHM